MRGDLFEPTFLSSIFLGVHRVSDSLLSKNLCQKFYVSITPTVRINGNDVYLYYWTYKNFFFPFKKRVGDPALCAANL